MYKNFINILFSKNKISYRTNISYKDKYLFRQD